MAGFQFGKTVILFGLGVSMFAGCATEPGRPPGPGAFVAGLGGGLVRAHDDMARALLGDKAGPMIIAPDRETRTRTAAPVVAERPRDDEATPAGGRVIGTLVGTDNASTGSVDADGDGFVTLDEIVTLARSGLSDLQVIERLERTQQVFELDEKDEQYLRVRGVTQDVILRMRGLNYRPVVVKPEMVSVPADGTPRAYDEGDAGRSTTTTLSN